MPKEKGGQEFLRWIGGYYEHGFSTNPHWLAEIKELPTHPITRGVRPFETTDEWYFNIHFRPTMEGVTPILVATPPERSKAGTDFPPSQGPTLTSLLQAGARKFWPGLSKDPMEDGASALRVDTVTSTGGTTTCGNLSSML